MSDLLKYLEPGKHGPQPGAADFTQVRKVPLQPEGVPIGVVFMGADLGNLPWSGTRPRAGDTVAVVGASGSRTVIGRERPVLRNPVFGDRCICRCPGSSNGGMIFYLTSVQDTTILLVVHGETGAILHYSTLPEVIVGTGVAVDPNEPHDLYILDNRQSTLNLSVDGVTNPDSDLQWYFMLKYVLSGGGYSFSAIELMPGYPTENPFDDSVNSLTVIDGVCWIALASTPATIRKWSGSGFTDLALTLDGAPYEARLLGPIVQVESRPAPTGSYFVLALAEDDTVHELVQFGETGGIQGRMRDAQMTHPQALLTVCNRLTIFQGQGDARSDPEDLVDDDEGEGGGGGGGGGGEEA